MAQRDRIDFSTQLPGGADPVSANGALLAQAGAIEGQAAVAGANATSTLIKQGISTAIDAAHGYLESNQEADINKTIEQLKASQTAARSATIFESADSTPEDLKKANEDLDKVQSALSQGTITREQAILAIDSKVKTYSNMLPGYASELRRKAVELTGVEHLGRYAEYAALNKQTMSEKLALESAMAKQKAKEKLTTDFITTYGRMPTTPQDFNMFATQKTLLAQAAEADAKSKLTNLSTQERETAFVDSVNKTLGGGIMQLGLLINGLKGSRDAKGQPIAPQAVPVQQAYILSEINTFFESMKGKVLETPSGALSKATRDDLMNRLDKQHTELVTGLKNTDNFNWYTKTMQLNKMEADDVVNEWIRRNRGLEIMRRNGLVPPEIVKLWHDAKDKGRGAYADFQRRHPEFDAYMRGSMAGAKEGSGGGGGAIRGPNDNLSDSLKDPTILDALKKTSPGEYIAHVNTLHDSVAAIAKEGWGQDPETQAKRKKDFASTVLAFTSQVDGVNRQMVSKFLNLTSNPNLLGRLEDKDIPKQDKLRVADAVVSKVLPLLETQKTGLFEVLKAAISEQANQLMVPTEMKLELNSNTGLFEIAAKQGIKPWSKNWNASLGGGVIRRTLDDINKAVSTLNILKETLPKAFPEGGNMSEDMLRRFDSGYYSLPYSERSKAIERATGEPSDKVPKLDKLIPTSELSK